MINKKDDSKKDYYEERVVAFVDILGFKAHVEETIRDSTKAERLHNALKSILERQIENEDIESLSLKEFGREVTVFSDSMVLSYATNCEGGLFYILMDLIHLQLELISYGVFLRGGISIGKVYHDGKIVYGPAMIESYELESNKAVYPRIIISEESLHMGITKTQATQNSLKEEIEYIDQLVKKDTDGLYYLDILRQDSELGDSGAEYYIWLYEVRKFIQSQIEVNKGVPRILEKYIWFAKYYNEVVTDENAAYPVPIGEGKAFRESYRELEIII